ncbi:peptidase M16 [Aphanothece hegewaldii CCALA 016]|uniref:Peptidase M16 n=1 Tax=Aphanothece hegewaldii CCALA 016 TaxID=2107694 RepID=A0A2T1M1X9_9CHRO|nr:pitrilysin family protein [Aphanothece hegewaldii]PSF38724.1 peptidase M16 [Aphanothece hegewaldii CCALA 016]
MKEQKVHRLMLENGITLLLVENQAADLIAGRIFLKNSGSRWENREKAGLFHLLAATLTKGSQKYSSVEIAEKVESIGAGLGADAGADYFVISLKTITADFAEILSLVAEIIKFPTFPENEVEREKYLTQQSIRSQQEQPFNVAFSQLREAMYPNHPYGLSLLGTAESVAQITRSDLEYCHYNHFCPEQMIISLSGRITVAESVQLIEDAFRDWKPESNGSTQLNLTPLQANPLQKLTKQETQQSIVMLGYLGASVKEDNYAILKLLNTYLGNGLSSRLFVELREKRGLAYDVSSFYPTRLEPSQFVIYMGTAPQNTAIAIDGLHTEAERLCETELKPEELQTAKNKLLGQYALGKQTNAEMAQLFGWYETLELGIEFDSRFQEEIANITPEMARKVANQYLRLPYLSLVGPAAILDGYDEP